MRDLHRVIWKERMSVIAILVHWKLRAANVWTVEDVEPVAQTAKRLTEYANHEQTGFQA